MIVAHPIRAPVLGALALIAALGVAPPVRADEPASLAPLQPRIAMSAPARDEQVVSQAPPGRGWVIAGAVITGLGATCFTVGGILIGVGASVRSDRDHWENIGYYFTGGALVVGGGLVGGIGSGLLVTGLERDAMWKRTQPWHDAIPKVSLGPGSATLTWTF